MRLRIYVDTSVFGGCEDVEFLKPSRHLVNSMAAGEYVCVISEVTLLELENAPVLVRDHLEHIPESLIEVLPLDLEAESLAPSTSATVRWENTNGQMHFISRLQQPQESTCS